MTAPDQPTEAPDAVLPDFLTPERRAETRAFMARNPDVTFRYSADAMRMLLDSLDALTARCEQAEDERDAIREEVGAQDDETTLRAVQDMMTERAHYVRECNRMAESLAAAEDERRAAQEREATAYRRRAGTIERLRALRAERDEARAALAVAEAQAAGLRDALEDVRARVHVQMHGGYVVGATPADQCSRWGCDVVNRALATPYHVTQEDSHG